MLFRSVCIMYLSKDMLLSEEAAGLAEDWTDMDSLLYGLGVSLVMAAVMTSIAVCVLVWIARNEGRTERLVRIWTTRREKRGKIITIPLVAAIVLSIVYMVADVILYKMMV